MPGISKRLLFKLTSVTVITGLILIDLPLYALPLKDDGDYSADKKNVSVSAGDNTEAKFDYLMEQAEAMVKHKADVKLAESEIKRKALVRITAEGLLESGMSDEEVVKVLSQVSSPVDALMALRKCGKDICWIARAFEKAGYSTQEIGNALPVDIDDTVKPAAILPRYAGSIFAPVPLNNNSVTQSNSSNSQSEDLSVSEDIPLKQETLKSEAAEELPLRAQAAVKEDRIPCSQALRQMEAEQGAGVNIARELYKAGYSKAEIVSAYIEKAAGWVKEKTVELINCAAMALAGVLNIKDSIETKELAVEIIYEDILVNGEVNIKDGQIQTSMSALENAAQEHGIEFNAYKLNDDELSQLSEPAILQLGSTEQGHWVVLCAINKETARILDNGEYRDISLAELKSLAGGNVLTTQVFSGKGQISEGEAKEIYGSRSIKKRFSKWKDKMGDKLKSFAKTSLGKAILMIAAAVLTAGIAWALAPALTGALGGVLGKAAGYGIGAFTSTLGTCSAKGMKLKDGLKVACIAAVTAAVCAGVGEKLSAGKEAAGNTAATAGTEETAKEAAKDTLVSNVSEASAVNTANTAATTAADETMTATVTKAAEKAVVSYAVQEGVEATGKDSPYLRIAAAGATGALTGAIDETSMSEAAVTSASMQAVNEAGAANEWDRTLTHAAAITAGTVTNAAITSKEPGSFSDNLNKSKGALIRAMVSSGVERIAVENNLDSNVGEALSTVSGSIAEATVSNKGLGESILQGTKYAAGNIALICISNQSGLDPAETAVIANCATALLNNEDLTESTARGAVRAINFGEQGSPSTSYDKAVYQSKINSFGERTGKGENAADILSESTTASFRQGAMENVLEKGGVADKLAEKIEALKQRFAAVPKDQISVIGIEGVFENLPEFAAFLENSSKDSSCKIEILQFSRLEKDDLGNIVGTSQLTQIRIFSEDAQTTIFKEEFFPAGGMRISEAREVALPEGNSYHSDDDTAGDKQFFDDSVPDFTLAKNMGEGFLERFQSREYEGSSPESLLSAQTPGEAANWIDENIGQKITEAADKNTEDVSNTLSRFGLLGKYAARRYSVEIKTKAFVARAAFETATEAMRFGAEIGDVCEDIKTATKAYSEGDEETVSRCIGRATASLVRETSRAATIASLGEINPKGMKFVSKTTGEKEVVKDATQTYYKGVSPGSYFDKNDPLKKGFRAKYPRRVNSPDNMAKQILENSDSPYVSVTKSKKIATDKYSILKGPEGPNQFIIEGKVYKIKLKESEVINPRDHLGKAKKFDETLIKEANKKAKKDAERLIYKKIKPENIERIK